MLAREQRPQVVKRLGQMPLGDGSDELADFVFLTEGDHQLQVLGLEAFGPKRCNKQFLDLRAHPEQVDARPPGLTGLARAFESGGDLLSQVRLDLDTGVRQVPFQPARRLPPIERLHLHDFRFLLQQLDEPAAPVGLHGGKHNGCER